MKTSDIALIAGAVGVGYLLLKNKSTEPSNGGGSGGVSLDLGGLIGGISLPGSGSGTTVIPGIGGGLNTDALLKGFQDTLGSMGAGLLKQIATTGENALSDLNKKIEDTLKDKIPNLPEIAIPNLPDLPGFNKNGSTVDTTGKNGGSSGTNWQPAIDRVANDAYVTGLAYIAKLVGPMVIRAIPGLAAKAGGKVALAATGVGAPIAVGWTLADILATGYEWATGNNVALLGFGDLFGWTKTKAPQNKEQLPASALPETPLPYQANNREAAKAMPEAPSYPESNIPRDMLINPVAIKEHPGHFVIGVDTGRGNTPIVGTKPLPAYSAWDLRT